MQNKLKTITTSILAAALGFLPLVRAQADTVLNGAGATFPYPIYSKWFDEYNKIHPDIKINYQSIGSGGGVKQFTAKTVDFGATDGPMSEKELFAVDGKSYHIPTVLGAVVATWNVPGVDKLNFTGQLLSDIFTGKVRSWDDPALKQLNPEAALPSMPITVVHRADGSGTTFCWTDYLSKVSPEWKSKVGTGKSVPWPTGLGAKVNEGVTGLVKQTKGAIGYVEMIYAKENGMPMGAVKNKAGQFVYPTTDAVSAAGAGVNMPKDYRVSIADAAGAESYPISTYTWLLVYEHNSGTKGQTLKKFLEWMLTDGQKIAPTLGYAPLPAPVRDMAAKTIQSIK